MKAIRNNVNGKKKDSIFINEERGIEMSEVLERAYAQEIEKGYDYRRAMEEASRCLLCHDAPCSQSCPAASDPAKFIRSLRFKNIKGAAETLRENNALAGTCARVCPYGRLCEEACSRSGIDKPINIGKIQRYLVEEEEAQGMSFIKAGEPNGKKVACVGAGPASLACARELARAGFAVTVYEAQEKAGGVLSFGIIPSRLPQDVVDFDIKTITDAGVVIKYGEAIGADGIAALKKEYDAVFVGVGLWQSKMVDIPGTDLEGVESAIDFLKKARTGEMTELPDNVFVVGGGDVAMDCVTTAKQLGAKNAAIVYRRTIAEAPADMDEVKLVQSMGIPMYTQFAPKAIHGQDGRVAFFETAGRDGESSMTLKADMVVFAIGQELAADYTGFELGEGIFTGGDMAHGKGATVVEAVADGKAAAEKIQEYLG